MKKPLNNDIKELKWSCKYNYIDCRAFDYNGKEYILELNEIENLILKMLSERGCDTEQTNRQHYPRIIIRN
jgi:hypothetical protein